MLGDERPAVAHVFRAKGAAHHQPGATPQEPSEPKTPSAESAIHSKAFAVSDALNRAFSACSSSHAGSWGDAAGLSDSAPLALNAGKGARTPTTRKRSANGAGKRSDTPFPFSPGRPAPRHL